MATTITANVNLQITADFVNSLDVGEVKYPIAYGVNYSLTDGVGANQAKAVFTDTRTLGASATENLDMAGVLLDAFGNALTFTKIKALVVKADAANTNDVLVGGHATAAFAAMFADATDKARVKPGGAVAFIAPDATGLAVTAGTADLLTVANSGAGTSVIYTVIIIGVI